MQSNPNTNYYECNLTKISNFYENSSYQQYSHNEDDHGEFGMTNNINLSKNSALSSVNRDKDEGQDENQVRDRDGFSRWRQLEVFGMDIQGKQSNNKNNNNSNSINSNSNSNNDNANNDNRKQIMKQYYTFFSNTNTNPNTNNPFNSKQPTINQQPQHTLQPTVIQQLLQDEDSQHTLQKHGIKIISNKSDKIWQKLVYEGNTYVQLVNSDHQGVECVYQVVIGQFFMTVSVLNLHINSPSSTNTSTSSTNNNKGNSKFAKEELLGEGSFAVVKKLTITPSKHELALKKIIFPKRKQLKYNNFPQNIINSNDNADCFQIRKAISEYCCYKICSMLKIGPQVIFQNSYDLICYNDCIEFQLELCENIPKNCDVQIYERDIKRCIKILHEVKIIHKDIKKSNTLYSPHFKSYVLSDFGLTHSVKQHIWQPTQTYFAGSPTHASPQLKKLLYNNEAGYVNLYLNDLHCFNVTLQQIKQDQGYCSSQEYSINPMSIGRNLYEDSNQSYGNYCSQQRSYNDGEFDADKNYRENGGECERRIESQMDWKDERMMGMSMSEGLGQDISEELLYYYFVKFVYRYYRERGNLQKINDFVKMIVEQVLQNEPKIQNLKEPLLKLIHSSQFLSNSIPFQSQSSLTQTFTYSHKTPHTSLTIPKESPQNSPQLIRIRNSIRLFGINSNQVTKQLQEISVSKCISLLNYSKVQIYLQQIKRNNKVTVKKYKNYFVNMERHLCLRNTQSLTSLLRTLIKNYLTANTCLQNQRQEILEMAIQVLSSDQLTQNQLFQLVSQLWQVYQPHGSVNKGNCTRTSKITYELYLNLVECIFKQFQQNNKTTPQLYSNMIKISFKYKQQKRAQQYYHKIQSIQSALFKRLTTIPIKQFTLPSTSTSTSTQTYTTSSTTTTTTTTSPLNVIQMQRQTILLGLCKILYYQLNKQYHKSMGQSIMLYNLYTEYQMTDLLIKINILQYMVSNLLRENKLEQAEIRNQDMKIVIEKHCFPKKKCIEFAFYYSYKGIINFQHKLYQEALNNFQCVIECTSDILRGSSCTTLIKQTLQNISRCYSNLGDGDKCLFYLEKALELCLNFNCFNQYEESIQILQHILIYFVKNFGKKSQDPKIYLEKKEVKQIEKIKVQSEVEIKKEVIFESENKNIQISESNRFLYYLQKQIKLKLGLFESKRLNFSNNTDQNGEIDHNYIVKLSLPLFPTQIFSYIGIPEPHIIQILIKLIKFAQNYFPAFQIWYIRVCARIYQYYTMKTKMPTKSIKYFHKIFSIDKTDQWRVIIGNNWGNIILEYCQALIGINSSRKAYSILKKYCYKIQSDDQTNQNNTQDIKSNAYKLLAQLSKDLNTNSKLFYQNVFKYKAMKNIEYLTQFEDRIDIIVIKNSRIVGKIWEKKINQMRNCMVVDAGKWIRFGVDNDGVSQFVIGDRDDDGWSQLGEEFGVNQQKMQEKVEQSEAKMVLIQEKQMSEHEPREEGEQLLQTKNQEELDDRLISPASFNTKINETIKKQSQNPTSQSQLKPVSKPIQIQLTAQQKIMQKLSKNKIKVRFIQANPQI